MYISLYSHHCWTSFEGSAEVYNEVLRETSNYNFTHLKIFLEGHPFKQAKKTKGMYGVINYVIIVVKISWKSVANHTYVHT